MLASYCNALTHRKAIAMSFDELDRQADGATSEWEAERRQSNELEVFLAALDAAFDRFVEQRLHTWTMRSIQVLSGAGVPTMRLTDIPGLPPYGEARYSKPSLLAQLFGQRPVRLDPVPRKIARGWLIVRDLNPSKRESGYRIHPDDMSEHRISQGIFLTTQGQLWVCVCDLHHWISVPFDFRNSARDKMKCHLDASVLAGDGSMTTYPVLAGKQLSNLSGREYDELLNNNRRYQAPTDDASKVLDVGLLRLELGVRALLRS